MKNYLKFWGTRGSCPVSGPEYAIFGGNTISLELRYEDTLVIFDAGTGIRPLGIQLKKENIRKVDLFLSHTHWDHISGLPFFDLLHTPGVEIHIWSPQPNCKKLFEDLLAVEFFPVAFDQLQSTLIFHTIHPKTPVTIGPISIDFHLTQHPGLTCGFKIKTPKQSIAYITDNEMFQNYHGQIGPIPPEVLEPYQNLITFFKHVDLLIHEAQYTPEEYLKKAGWGHSSIMNTIGLVQQTAPQKWYVTHHEPKHSDKELRRLAKFAEEKLIENEITCPVEWVPDGFVIELK
jgi:phosphoribosyl 1,2-cyclic phosphodiesterase